MPPLAAVRGACASALVCLCACGGPPPPPASRLVDLYEPEVVEGRVEAAGRPVVRTEWRFDAPPPADPAGEWKAGNAVAGLAAREGRLVGKTTGDFPVVHVARTRGLEDEDLLHEVQVRLRASGGANLAVSFAADEKLDMEKVLAQAAGLRRWRITSPLVPGDETRTYTLRSPFPVKASSIRHVLVRPTDAEGATFAIESVRLVFRREYLASIPSGPSWQGLSEVSRETLVSRSPETLRFSLRLPARPVLDLALGTIEDGPVTFRVTVGGGPGGPETVVLEKTITRPHRWVTSPVDLAAFGGRTVSLALSTRAEAGGTLAFWGAPAVRARTERPPGVIVVWADTLRRDHLGPWGYSRPTSPVLDRLAREGTVFRDCIGQASWTKVATPSVLTSLYPTSHGVREFSDRLPSSATTLAEVYREAGYATVSYSSILFTGRFTNLHQGFEELHEDGSLPDRNSSKTSREYVDRLLPWLEAHRDVPFFVFLHVADPHDPYRPYPPYDTMWADAAAREGHERDAAHVKTYIADPLLREFGMPSWSELEKARLDPRAYVARDRDWYDGSIRAMDAEMGRLAEGLQALGLTERTLFVFTGDHGEEFLDHGRMFHGQSVYGELVNLPLILRQPGTVPAGVVVDATVQTIDVMPTLLSMSGLAVPRAAQGRSLLPLLTPPPGSGAVKADAGAAGWSDRPAISEKALITDVAGPPPRVTESVAIVSGGWKLIHNLERPPGDPEYELYDHRRDPNDQTDVSAEQPEVVRRLARQIGLWKRSAEAERLKPDSEAAHGMSAEELERLRSLGYIQ